MSEMKTRTAVQVQVTGKDGKLRWKTFESQDAADAFLAGGATSPRVEAFIASRTWPRGRDTVARGILAQFILFEAKADEPVQGELPLSEPTDDPGLTDLLDAA